MTNVFLGLFALFTLFLSPVISSELRLFKTPLEQILYFHSHRATARDLSAASPLNPIFEIDLAWAHSTFNDYVKEGTPYIGHPEEFYTILGKEFPADNVTLQAFQTFCLQHPLMKILIDVKDETVFPDLENFITTVGPERCIVHAFIKNWTEIPEGMQPEPHWYREDVDLFALDALLTRLQVPLIANCRGRGDEHVKSHSLLTKMFHDAKECKSIVALGLYYPGATLPCREFLESINIAGYYAWLNGNEERLQERVGTLRYIGMVDDLSQCTRF